MDSKKITEVAFRLFGTYFEIYKQHSLDPEALDRITKRIRRLRAGLDPEMEFVAAVNWLSRALVVHRLDQIPMPKCHTPDGVKIPDIIAVPISKGIVFPV